MSVTKKGTGWEILNSLWLFWPFTLLLNFVAFFWIGGRTGQRKWIWSGVVYFLVDGVLLYAGQLIQQWNDTVYGISMILMLIGWPAAILQAFLSRKEYLLRREAVLDLQNATQDAYRKEIRSEYFGGNAPQPAAPAAQRRPVQPSPAGIPPVMSPGMLDLNLAAEQQLAALPGVGVALAKRAVDLRMQTGGFASVDDFCARLQLMPHFVQQIHSRAFVSPPLPQTPPTASPAPQKKPADNARVVDI